MVYSQKKFTLYRIRNTVNLAFMRQDYAAFLEITNGKQGMHFFGKGIYGMRH